ERGWGLHERSLASKIDDTGTRSLHRVRCFQILSPAGENDLVRKVIRKPAKDGYVIFHRPIAPEKDSATACLKNDIGMIDPVGESAANSCALLYLHLVDHSRRYRRSARVLRHFQRHHDIMSRIFEDRKSVV